MLAEICQWMWVIILLILWDIQKNVIINYLDNRITGEYLDFSIQRNSMIVSRDVIYTNLENILKSDIIEINISTKDTKIFMYQNNKKVNIKSKK